MKLKELKLLEYIENRIECNIELMEGVGSFSEFCDHKNKNLELEKLKHHLEDGDFR